MLEDPPVNFAISTRGAQPGIDHLGIQTDDAAELAALKARAEAADMALLDEGETTCCYARSEKHWVTDPQGIAWEHFHTLGNIPRVQRGGRPGGTQSACCTPTARSRRPQLPNPPLLPPRPQRAARRRRAASRSASRSSPHPLAAEGPMTTHVLILCTHNSARSVLAEGMLNHWANKLGRDVKAHSAGSAPSGRINPFAIEALNNAGIDTTAYRSKSWDEFSRDGAPPLSIVITVCDSAAAETCPVFFGGGTGAQPVKVHWGYPDPSQRRGRRRRQAARLRTDAPGHRLPHAAAAGAAARIPEPQRAVRGAGSDRPQLSSVPVSRQAASAERPTP